jgi:hypothetical protein
MTPAWQRVKALFISKAGILYVVDKGLLHSDSKYWKMKYLGIVTVDHKGIIPIKYIKEK